MNHPKVQQSRELQQMLLAAPFASYEPPEVTMEAALSELDRVQPCIEEISKGRLPVSAGSILGHGPSMP